MDPRADSPAGTSAAAPAATTALTGAPTGALDEALERLHASGPERLGRLSNHAPMAVEALAAHGLSGEVHRWLELYAPRLEEYPSAIGSITRDNWREALGDPRRAADWIAYFEEQTGDSGGRPWRDVLAEWWPRLLPGIYGGATHPAIRVGHAVRALLSGEETRPRRTELAPGLGYWAARHHPVTGVELLPASTGTAAAALDSVEPIPGRDNGNYPDRLGRIAGLPAWGASVTDPDEAHRRLTELVCAATHRYATHGHGEATMLVHAATAPNAVLRTLPALPRALWAPGLHAAWTASAAVTSMYAPDAPVTYTAPGTFSPEEVFERALAHGDEHVIKFTDTALDVAASTGDERALTAALRAIELSEPLT
ncbi:hypothetical protein GCM10010277_50430 [Streptomyces longisporoflavus]|uniref:questin oxidase family protein n=1 Tax=Streptomyces longisporoflavus TaxID=28044 RepID=UPI00167D636A|nr:questin oxidase family protein [Streptomyces longisporoflavus]GGV53078.1 hypothetical protein GCM10010277_50430 [Streptomyces longisporoflavus]